MANNESTPDVEPTPPAQEGWLGIASLILGILGIVGFGFLTGVPAIVTGTIALTKNQANRSMSITGIILGIISTVLSLLFILLIIAAIAFGIDAFNGVNLPDYAPENFAPSQDWVESSRT